MMNFKRTICLGLVGGFLLTSTGTGLAADVNLLKNEAKPILISAEQTENLKISSYNLNDEGDNYKININLPVIKGMLDKEFETKFNQEILAKGKKAKEELIKNAKELKGITSATLQLIIEYDVKLSGDIISFVIKTYTYTGGANGNQQLDTYNIKNGTKSERMELKDLFQEGIDYKTVFNSKIKEQINKEKDKYFTGELGFQSIKDNQDFYIENNNLVFCFDEYEIGPGVLGAPELKIFIDEQLQALLKTNYKQAFESNSAENVDQSYIEINGNIIQTLRNPNDNKLLMMPLRAVADNLGYEVKWDAETRSVNLSKGNQFTTVKIGENKYIFAKMAPFPLEAAPIIVENTTYVPLSFAKKVLKQDILKIKE